MPAELKATLSYLLLVLLPVLMLVWIFVGIQVIELCGLAIKWMGKQSNQQKGVR